MIEAEQPTALVEPGTPMLKAIPPRLVEPYLAGQRSVIAGYVYRASDCPFSDPAHYYTALGLDYSGSDFTPDLGELYVLRWLALDMSASLRPAEPGDGGPGGTVAEFYTLPVPIPVGAEIHRITAGAEEFIARYDGQAWLPR